MVSTAAAAISSQATSYCPTNKVSTTVSGCELDVRLKMSGTRKLFQVESSATKNTAMMPGRANGNTIRARTCQRSQPSTKAASSISGGISRTKVAISQIESGAWNTMKISDRPGSVSSKLSCVM